MEFKFITNADMLHAMEDYMTLSQFYCSKVRLPNKNVVDFIAFYKRKWIFCMLRDSADDFYHKREEVFFGNLNYYVLPLDLYETVKEDIPDQLGVYTVTRNDTLFTAHYTRKPARLELQMSEKALQECMMRAMFRENLKLQDQLADQRKHKMILI